MKKEMGKILKETMSKAAIEAAMKTIRMPNQFCGLFIGEPHSEMAIQPKDYKELALAISRSGV